MATTDTLYIYYGAINFSYVAEDFKLQTFNRETNINKKLFKLELITKSMDK